MKAGHFAAAERLLRERLPHRIKLDLAEDQLMLGVCLLERARAAKPDEAAVLFDEAWNAFNRASAEAGRPPLQDVQGDRSDRIRTQAQIRGMQVLQQTRRADQLLATAPGLIEKNRGTVEELILLSLTYHAHKQKGDAAKAAAVRDQMKEAFGRLPAAAFTAEKGEYSRGYWEKEWFGASKP